MDAKMDVKKDGKKDAIDGVLRKMYNSTRFSAGLFTTVGKNYTKIRR